MTWLVASLALAADPSPPGEIREVTVFPDRAAVTRVLPVTLATGTNEVVFSDLPPSLDEHTLQASGLGEGARILGIDVRSRELEEDRRARVSELEGKLQDKRDELVAAKDRETAATAELTFLQKVGAEAAEQLSAELLYDPGTPKDAEAMAGLLRSRVPEVQTAAREARFAARDLEAGIAALERELSTVRGAAQWSRRDVTVLVEATTAGEGEVSLTYVLPGASWTPAYDARAEPAAGKVALSMNALVVQTTGEDWTDAKLLLSTASPSGGVQPPEVVPFWLEASYGWGYQGGGAGAYDSLSYDEDDVARKPSRAKEAAEPPPPPMEVAQAVVTERAVASTFEVAGAASVPGDGTRRKLRVADLELKSTFQRVVVPRMEAAAFLVAKSTWDHDWPLLAGEVSSFVDGAFSGTGYVATTGRGADVELGFGRDDAVRVEVVVTADTVSEKGGKGKAVRGWTYTVTDGRKEAVDVVIRDSVPQTRDSKFKVKATGDDPDETGPEGAVTWNRALAPSAAATVAFGYEIRYPTKHPPGVIP